MLKVIVFAWLPTWKAGYDTKSRTLYPAQAITNTAVSVWYSHYNNQLQHIGGDPYLAGSIAFYADHFIRYEPERAILKTGGMLVYARTCTKHDAMEGIAVTQTFKFLGKGNKSNQQICFILKNTKDQE